MDAARRAEGEVEDPAYTAWKAWHGCIDDILPDDCPDAATCCDAYVAGWHARDDVLERRERENQELRATQASLTVLADQWFGHFEDRSVEADQPLVAAFCDHAGILVYGETVEAALERMGQAVDLWMKRVRQRHALAALGEGGGE